jgi:hypothetical protein
VVSRVVTNVAKLCFSAYLCVMRRVLATLFLLMYSIANFGLSVRLDLCGNSVSGIGLYSTESVKSECCIKMAPDENCCDSEQVFLQDSSDKAQPQASQTIPVVLCLSWKREYQGPFFRALANDKTCYAAANSPSPPAVSLHLIHSCFLI